ncbi:MAG: ornithine cyclodeaminase family protein [Pseudomonadota bacterium]|nr:ornithine cyclodeaminase family protein [Pseudomonadota bacterium]
MTLILNNQNVRDLLTMEDVINVLEFAYKELAEGRGALRRRSDTIVTSDAAADAIYALKSMDGIAPSLGVSAIRINSDIITHPKVGDNFRRVKVPAAPGQRYTGLVLLFSTETGEPLAIFPDGEVQPMRVAGTSALASQYLAKDGARSVALIGTGWQAQAQLRAIDTVHEIADYRVYSTQKENRDRFAMEWSEKLGTQIRSCDSAEEAVAGTDIVLLATNSVDHVARDVWLEPGMHVSSIKSPEISGDVINQCDVVVCHVPHGRPTLEFGAGASLPNTSGLDVDGLAAEIGLDDLPTLADIVSGKVPGRTSDDQITCFLNILGLGYQFAAVGSVLHRKAKEAGMGNQIPTDWLTQLEVP